MMTVRFATGVSVQYNSAVRCISHETAGYTDLFESGPTGQWVARVPTGACLLEGMPPCRIYDGVSSAEIAADFLRALETDVGRMPADTLCRIKRVLQLFDATRKTWKADV